MEICAAARTLENTKDISKANDLDFAIGGSGELLLGRSRGSAADVNWSAHRPQGTDVKSRLIIDAQLLRC